MKKLLTIIFLLTAYIFAITDIFTQITQDTVYVLYKDHETQDTITAPKQVPIYVQSRDLRVQDKITSRSYSNGLISVYELNFGRHNYLNFETDYQEQFVEYKFEEDSVKIKNMFNKLISFNFLSIPNFTLFNRLFNKKNIIYLIDPADIDDKSIKFKKASVHVQEYKRE